MKHIIVVTAVIALFGVVTPASAAPFVAAKNPQIVANYNSGLHGIPGEPETHEGLDVVMRAGKSGNFQQWFYGTSTENGGITEGDHSVWKLSPDKPCKSKETEVISTPTNFWGDYLQQGVRYCVNTNDFKVSKI